MPAVSLQHCHNRDVIITHDNFRVKGMYWADHRCMIVLNRTR
ncbi:MAG: hypothetical protein ABSE07_09875 [Methanoregula sp.]